MLKHRVIPALLLRDNGLVKTVKFKDPKYVGDPVNAIRIFNEKEVDELMLIDIYASRKNVEPNYAMIEHVAGECFMPLAYGGGIRTIEQARRIFALGVEKICLQTSALDNPRLINEVADQYGSQSIVVSIDVKRSWLGKPQIYRSSAEKTIDGSWIDTLRSAVNAGAGEVLLGAVDKDGTLSGPDLHLIREASASISVPMIALGGISSLIDIKDAVDAGASAVAVGSFFVFHGPHRAVLITYPEYNVLENLLSK
jgi:cyclase